MEQKIEANNNVEMHSKLRISTFPQYLVLQVNRYILENGQQTKLSIEVKVKVDNLLDYGVEMPDVINLRSLILEKKLSEYKESDIPIPEQGL